MKNILTEILDIKDNDSNRSYDTIRKKLKAISDDDFSYSEIAEFFFEMKNGDIEYFYKNIDSLKKISLTKKDNLHKKLNKIKNHIQLEESRSVYLESKQKTSINNTTDESLQQIKTMKDKLDEYDKKIDNHNKEISNLYANIMTIIGLFSAIVVTFFGGLSSITNIFININTISKYRLVFIILIVVFAMFNIVFMLLYYISIITNKTLSKDCHHNCKKSETPKSRSGNINCTKKNILCSGKRYPFIFYFNILLILMMIFIFIDYSGIIHEMPWEYLQNILSQKN